MHKSPRIIFEGVGSAGDILPLLELARAMNERGHESSLLGPQRFAERAEALGVHFVPVSNWRVQLCAEEARKFASYVFMGLSRTAEHFRSLARPPALVVNFDRFNSSNLACEALGIPALRLHLCPFKILSLASPPWPFRAGMLGPMKTAYLRYKLPRVYRSLDEAPQLVAYVNQQRLALGLQPIQKISELDGHVRRELCLFPDWYCAPASDWREGTEQAGFPLPAPRAQLPEELVRFLEREGAPLVFTAGTSASSEQELFTSARRCCAELRRPGILLGGRAPALLAGERVMHVDFVELPLLLARASVLVHHGGVGTTARALEAGIPQIVSPGGFDQPDNARRSLELGVARIVDRAMVSGPGLAQAIRELEAAPELPARLAAVRERCAADAGVQRAADVIERELAALPSQACSVSVPERMAPAAPARASAEAAPLASGARVGAARTVLFIVWPERGHIAVPVAIAKQLRQRGDRVVFAGVSIIGARLRSLGFEFFELAKGYAPWEPKESSSVFWNMPPREQFGSAVDELLVRFQTMCEIYSPSLILIDSLYSAIGILPEAASIPWAQYETDLPREFDPLVPPGELLLPPAGAATAPALRQAWAEVLANNFRKRNASRGDAVCAGWAMSRDFPDALIQELHQRLGTRLRFERRTVCSPVARAPRLVFCPRELDFERSRSNLDTHWVGPCLDTERVEQPFPWHTLPDRPLVYCALGTQSIRNPRALSVLGQVLATFAQRPDLCLVVACHRKYLSELGPVPEHILLLDEAPQWTLLGRARLAITHAGFNSLKECVARGVPMIAIPLSHDQPRNASLIEHRRLGVAIDPEQLSPEALHQALRYVTDSSEIRANTRRFQRLFADSAGFTQVLGRLDALMARADGEGAAAA